MPSVLNLTVAVLFLSILPAQVYALTPAQVFEKVKDSIVVVQTLDTKGKVKVQGSGVLISSDRVATNCHVVEGGASYQVGRGNQFFGATLFAEDGDKDICLLDAKGITGKPVQLGKAANLKVGVPVYAVGAPRGLELSLSDGIVAQLRGGPPPFIQATAAISPGSSGGGLFDGEGRLVGLTTLYIEGGQSLNFAIPVEWIGEVKPGIKPVTGDRSQIDWWKRAKTLENLKDWQGLIDWCRKWTKSQPKDTDPWVILGFVYLSLNRHNEAIDAYRQALRINSEYAEAWYNLGFIYSSLNRYNEAIDAYRLCLHLAPEYADAWYNLGLSYGHIKRYNEAIDPFRQCLRINPEDAKAWYSLGLSYLNFKHYNEAIEAYRQFLHLAPEYADAWYNLGLSYGHIKRYNEAIDPFRQCLRINPKDAKSWYHLGLSYLNLNRYNEAIDAYRQCLGINPEYTDAWANLGFAYVHSGNRQAALEAVRELRRLDPEKAGKLFNLIVPR